jgi:hypothetical protein
MSATNPYASPASVSPDQAGMGYQTRPLKPLATVTNVLKVLYIGHLIAAVVGAGVTVFGMTISMAELESPNPSPQVIAFVIASLIYGLGYLGLFFLTVIMHCIWTYRASNNAEALGAIGKDYTPGWSVGWFFIPFANLIYPYKVAKEIFTASKPGPSGREWQTAAAPGYLGWWWGCYIISGFMNNFSLRMSNQSEAGMVAAGEWVGLFAEVPSFIAAFLALKYVTSVFMRQQETADAAEPAF